MLQLDFKYWDTLIKFSISLLFSRVKKKQLLQHFLEGQVLQLFDHLHSPLLNPFQSICLLFESQEPELDTVFQARPAVSVLQTFFSGMPVKVREAVGCCSSLPQMTRYCRNILSIQFLHCTSPKNSFAHVLLEGVVTWHYTSKVLPEWLQPISQVVRRAPVGQLR